MLRCVATSIAALVPSSALAQSVASPLPAPQPIVDGFEAKTCQFPSAVSMMTAGDFSFCTGTLVHPEIVLYAGHCHAAAHAAYVAFGERADAPARTVATAACAAFPGYVSTAESIDLAYCRLSEPVTDVPIVPLATGCEIDAIDVGDEVMIIGFGASDAVFDENGEATGLTGGGVKRYTTQTVETIDEGGNDLVLVGGGSSACYGDSGGPVMIELPDGSWRVLGAASTVHPDPGDYPSPCGYGVVYEIAWNELDWLETSGFDVTPCHDGDAFVPGSACGSFPSAPGELGNTWANGCATSNLVEAPMCGAGDDAPPLVDWITPDTDLVDDASSVEVSVAIEVSDAYTGVAEVWLRINGADQPTVLDAPPFTFDAVVFPQGSYELVAVARDHAGNVGESVALTIEVGIEDELPGESSTDGGDADEPTPDPEADDEGDALPPYVGDRGGGSYGCNVSGHGGATLPLLALLAIVRRRPFRRCARSDTSVAWSRR